MSILADAELSLAKVQPEPQKRRRLLSSKKVLFSCADFAAKERKRHKAKAFCAATTEIVRRLRPFFLLVLEWKGQSEDEDENADEDDSVAALPRRALCTAIAEIARGLRRILSPRPSRLCGSIGCGSPRCAPEPPAKARRALTATGLAATKC